MRRGRVISGGNPKNGLGTNTFVTFNTQSPIKFLNLIGKQIVITSVKAMPLGVLNYYMVDVSISLDSNLNHKPLDAFKKVKRKIRSKVSKAKSKKK